MSVLSIFCLHVKSARWRSRVRRQAMSISGSSNRKSPECVGLLSSSSCKENSLAHTLHLHTIKINVSDSKFWKKQKIGPVSDIIKCLPSRPLGTTSDREGSGGLMHYGNWESTGPASPGFEPEQQSPCVTRE